MKSNKSSNFATLLWKNSVSPDCACNRNLRTSFVLHGTCVSTPGERSQVTSRTPQLQESSYLAVLTTIRRTDFLCIQLAGSCL